MRFAAKLIVLALLSVAIGSRVSAQSPRQQLTQIVEQFQKTPTDETLREKIIKLALTLVPAPALPVETERRMARGRAAFTGATSVADYRNAAIEFEQATIAAPWYSDAYYNLGVAQDKAENYEAALRSLKLALMATPDSKEITALIFEVEYRQEKANSPEVRAAKEREANKLFIASLEGAKYVCRELRDNDDARRVEIEIRNGMIDGANVTTWINPRLTPGVNYASNGHVGFQGLWFDNIPVKGRVSEGDSRVGMGHMRVELYDDRLVYSQQMTLAGDSAPTVYPTETCLRTK